MQYPILIKPQNHVYLLFYAGIATIASISTLLSSSLIYKNISVAYGVITGLWLGIVIRGSYDVITKFRRHIVTITDSHVQIPVKNGMRFLSPQILDKARTITYMSEKNSANWLSYSVWLVNGQRYQISKLLYTASDLKIILEKLGCDQTVL